jgi:ketosteroid isomerase-like protein
VKRFFEDTAEAWEEITAQLEDFFERGDKIVVLVRWRVRPRGSSAAIETAVAHLWTKDGGRLVRLEQFPSREQALEALGLSEQDTHADS